MRHGHYISTIHATTFSTKLFMDTAILATTILSQRFCRDVFGPRLFWPSRFDHDVFDDHADRAVTVCVCLEIYFFMYFYLSFHFGE